MKKQTVKVGVVGCGGICKATYMDNMVKKFEIIEVIGVTDLIDARAQFIADKYHVEKMSLQELMEDPRIEVVVNLTYPESHVEITRMAFEHGKPCRNARSTGNPAINAETVSATVPIAR